jgi:ABC-type transport system involved in multi-copper enzyme maturation permease subunit
LNPFIRDATKALRAPGVWLAVAMLIVVPAIVLSTDSAILTTNNQSYELEFAVTTTYGSEYDFAFCVFDGAGTPVAGALANVTVASPNSSGVPIRTVTGWTSTNGRIVLPLNLSYARYQVTYSVSNAHSSTSEVSQLNIPDNGATVAGPGVISAVGTGNFSVTPLVAVAFPEPNSESAPSLTLTYNLTEPAGAEGTTPHIASGSLGEVSTTPQLFHFPLPSGLVGNLPVMFHLVNSAGSDVANQSLSLNSITPAYGETQQAGEVLQDWLQVTEFLALAAGVLIGYVTYGRDRITGALEPVIALPVTRTRVAWMRFAGAAAGLAIATGSSVIVLVWAISAQLSVETPASIALAAWVATFAGGLCLAALTMLLSHLSRSHAVVLGGGVALAAGFTLLWRGLTQAVSSFLGVPSPTQAMASWKGSVGLLSPGMAMTNPVSWGVTYSSPNGSQILPASTYPVVAGVVIFLWIALPLFALALCIRNRD